MKGFLVFVYTFGFLTISAANDRWIPHVTRPDGGFETSILVSNSSIDSGTVMFRPYDQQGRALTQYQVTLRGGDHIKLPASSMFSSEQVSHFSIEGSNNCLVTAAYRVSPSRAGGTAHVKETSEIGTRFVLYQGEWDTIWDGMALVNVSQESASVVGSRYDSSGHQTFRKVITTALPPKSKELLVFSAFFPDQPDEQIVIETSEPCCVVFLRGSLEGEPSYLYQSKPVIPEDGDHWIAHVTKPDGGFQTEMILTNTSQQIQLLALQPFDDSGNALAPANVEVPASGFVKAAVSEIISDTTVSHFCVEENEFCAVTACYRVTPDRIGGTAHVQQTGGSSNRFILYQGEWENVWDGMAIVNTGDQNAYIQGIRYNTDGEVTFRGLIASNLPPRSKRLLVFDSLFPNEPGDQIIIESSQPASVVFLRGSLGGDPAYLYFTDPIDIPAVGSPILKTCELLNRDLVASFENHLAFALEFFDQERNLDGGKMIVAISDSDSIVSRIEVDLDGPRYDRRTDEVIVQNSFLPNNSDSFEFQAFLLDQSGNSSLPVRFKREVTVQSMLYDDFDGHGCYHPSPDDHLAIDGTLSPQLWDHGVGVVGNVSPRSNDGGNVVKLILDDKETQWTGLELLNPSEIPIDEVVSFSMEAMIPSGNTASDFFVNLAVFTWMPEFENDPYWSAQIHVAKGTGESYWVGCGWPEKKTQDYVGDTREIQPNTWYELRMDIQRFGSLELLISFYLDNELLFSGIPGESNVLLDPSRLDWGPFRNIHMYMNEPNGTAIAYVDSVHAVFHRLVLEGISPDTISRGERVPVTIRGDGFDETSVPYAAEWGLNFIDVEFVNKTELRAIAVAHKLAEPGTRMARVASPPLMHSSCVPINIVGDPLMDEAWLTHGGYDDFDGNGCYQSADEASMADEGHLNPSLWSVDASMRDVSVFTHEMDAGNHVLVLEMPDGMGDGVGLGFALPQHIDFEHIASFSADVFIPSDADTDFDLNLGIYASLTRFEDRHWNARVSLSRTDTGEIRASSGWEDKIAHVYVGDSRKVDPSTWHNLRIDAMKIDEKTLRIWCFVDDELLFSGVPEQSESLVNPSLVDFGPVRDINLWKGDPNGNARVLVDNVCAVYALKKPNPTPVYDDFDGLGVVNVDGQELAREGLFSGHLWGVGSNVSVVRAEDYLDNAGDHGFVVRMTNGGEVSPRSDPEVHTSWENFGSFSADLLISSESSPVQGGWGIDCHVGVPAMPPGKSFYIQMGAKVDGAHDNYTFAYSNWTNKNNASGRFVNLGEMQFDTWYNLRFDIVLIDDDQFRVDYFLDNFLKTSELVPGSGQLLWPNNALDPNQYADGGISYMAVGDDGGGTMVVYMDNVRAIYNRPNEMEEGASK